MAIMENFVMEGEKINTEISKESELQLKNESLVKENKELKDKLETSNQLIRIISHDLKTPIGNTRGLLGLYLSEFDDFSKEEIKNSLLWLYEQSKNTEKLLYDLLELNRLQKDGIIPEIKNLNLEEQIEEALLTVRENASRKKIDLSVEINEESFNNSEVKADPLMLQTVIRNLTSNAVKFTNEGGKILISYKQDNNLMKIFIKDDGVGLSEERINNLFKKIRETTEGTNKEKGTGFGLSICKLMIEKMGGNISVESEGEGKGSTFIITLPLDN